MPISIMQWLVEIGMFFRKSKVRYRDRILLPAIRPLFSCSLRFHFAFITLILLTCGDIESNPGPRCLILEISINNKKGYVVSLYRSPSQTPGKFDSFINNFEKLITDIYSRKADFVLMIGDFNAKICNWSINDTTTPEGAQLDSITPLYRMKQLISESTHILQQSSSCIDLIFTNQPNIVMDSSVDSSLHPKCHHQIIYSKLNIKIEYTPPYIREIWNYSRAEADLINRAVENCDWPWINEEIQSLIHRKNFLYPRQKKSGSIDYTSLNALTLDISNAISSSKLKYHERLANKLNDPKKHTGTP